MSAYPNPHIGESVNGWILLDRATFESAVVDRMIAGMQAGDNTGNSGFAYVDSIGFTLNCPPGVFLNLPAATGSFTVRGFDMGPYTVPNDNAGGLFTNNYDLAAAAPAFAAWIKQANTPFFFDGVQVEGQDRSRVSVAYVRYGNSVVSLQAHQYYSPGGWVAGRSILVFFFGTLFSVIGVPILTGETAALASATAAQGVSYTATGIASISGNQDLSLIAKVGKIASGNISADDVSSAATQESTPVDDLFDDIDFSDTFGSFNFSSGEMTPFVGDAENVDYGLGNLTPDAVDPQDITGFGAPPATTNLVGDVSFANNATPEVTTNDFGTTFTAGDDANTWGDGLLKSSTSAVPLATAAATAHQTPQSAGVASSGATGQKAAAIASGPSDIVSTLGGFLSSGAKAAGGVMSQLTTAQPKTYAGQLTSQGGAGNVGAISNQTLILAGVALLGLAVVMHLGGK